MSTSADPDCHEVVAACSIYFLTVRGETRICSLSQSSSAIRSSPQVRFSVAIRRIKRRTSADIDGRPTGLDFKRQKRRNAARCQPIKVAGLTISKALRQSKKRASLDKTNRSAALVGAAFFSRSWNKASCLRRKQILCSQSGPATQAGSAEVDAVGNENF